MKRFALIAASIALIIPSGASASGNIWWPSSEDDDSVIDHNVPGLMGGLIPGGDDLIELEDILRAIRDGKLDPEIENCPLGGIICIRMEQSISYPQNYVTDYSEIQSHPVEYVMCAGDGFWGDDGEWHEGNC